MEKRTQESATSNKVLRMGNRQIPKLASIAFDVLKKSQLKYLKENGFFSTDIFSISSDASNKIQEAHELTENVMLDLFLQAVIDDDRNIVAELLDKNPELLLVKAKKGVAIQSQHTWLTIDAEDEDALSIAVKRKQIKMVELMLPYYDKLEQTPDVLQAKSKALSAWVFYKMQKNEEGAIEIVIPREYSIYAQSLIDVFRNETFPNGTNGKFSEKTELAIESLFNILLPKRSVKLDDYLDPELFLLALYKAYNDNFALFQGNWKQLEAFCIRVIGLVQSVLSPETAKIFCEGLYYVVEESRSISPRASLLKLLSGEAFYRSGFESRVGLGFEYLCSGRGHGRAGLGGRGWRGFAWKISVEQKQQIFGILRSDYSTSQINILSIVGKAV